MKVTAIFDIGRTNKKFFLFDKKLRQVYREYISIPEIVDEDGFACDNIRAIETWVGQTLARFINDKKYIIDAVNFSSYGASLVHIDDEGNPVCPLYNYLKPIPAKIIKDFHKKYGNKWRFAKETASPPLGMLNSGMQLYWIKHAKPKLFKRIRWSLHLPHYLSYLFTGVPVSDFTSIGCHTALWNYEEMDYHKWVYKEQIQRMLAPIVDSCTCIDMLLAGQRIKVGVGIHDSSAALLPYFTFAKNPFLLLSTGTWSISLNPFSDASLSKRELRRDVLKFMQIDGAPVRASRIFLGHEFKLQTKGLLDYFKKKSKYHHGIKLDRKIVAELRNNYKRRFRFNYIDREGNKSRRTDLTFLANFEVAYHQLMLELVELQIKNSEMAMGKVDLDTIYIDGGFASNDIYVKLLADHFSNHKILTAQSALGSALGAAIAISEKKISKKSLSAHYQFEKHN